MILDLRVGPAAISMAETFRVASPVSRLLTTNAIPSEHEASLIRSALVQRRTDLAEFDAESIRLQAALTQVLRERDQLRTHVEALEGILSPARKLPPELVAAIFRYCLPVDRYPEPDARNAPLLLCQICHGWREVALSTPDLWSSISFTKGAYVHPSISLIDRWLARSGVQPLSFQIDRRSCNQATILKVLIRYSHRWRDIELSTALVSTMVELARVVEVQLLPPLESLVLNITRFDDSLFSDLHLFLQSAPLLHRLSLHGTLYRDLQRIRLPWTQLTELALHDALNIAECLDILRQCPNLVSLTLRGLVPSVPYMGSLTTLCHLRTINISSAQPGMSILFDSLCIPKLVHLKITLYPTATWSHEQVLSLPTRSNCCLESLVLSGGEIMEMSLIDYLRLMPSLRVLSIRIPPAAYVKCKITDHILLLFTSRIAAHTASEQPCLLPKLEVLRINVQCQCTQSVLADMIESRWWPSNHVSRPLTVTRLKVVELEPEHALDKDVITRLKKCRDGGLEFPNWRDLVEGPSYL